MRILLILLFSFSYLSAQNTAGLNVPPRQQFILGEYMQESYTATLKNRGRVDVTVKTLDKASQTERTSTLLLAGEKITVAVAADAEVRIFNRSDRGAELLVRMSKSVQGMRYLTAAGDEIDRSATASGDRLEVAPPAGSPAAPVREFSGKISRKNVMVIGEGTPGGYSVTIHNQSLRGIVVSVRDRSTGETTQGFGLGGRGRETVHIRPHEVLYLLSERGGRQQVRVETSIPVTGARIANVL